ncbi:MAG TPA: PD-(D/E)XK nuclease family protein, partial [Fimbriimonas sp.]|nr:PD-(D/E)XK nuclease family protein [Fimbriimonas sp.]
RDTRARNRIEQIITDHVSVQVSLGQRLVTFREVVATLRGLMESADVSIPASEVGVVVTNQAEAIPAVDTLFVLGMLEGIFPRRRSEDPVLTDAERDEISRLRSDKPALRNSHDRAQEERDEFYRVCAAAKNALVFSYPAADDDRDNIPAFYLEEVKRCVEVRESNYARSLLAPGVDHCTAEADHKFRAALDGESELPPAVELLTHSARDALVPTIDGHSPGELRDALQCPFAYMARRRLNLRPKRHQTRWASLRRLPQAAQIATQEAGDVEKSLAHSLETVLEEMASDVPEWELQLLRSGGARLIADWVRREIRAREKWPKDEGSVRLSVLYGDGLNDVMPRKLARLKGAMPAVSEMQGYRVGHLYVSRAPEERELTDTDKLYYGLHFLALHRPESVPALEIETMSGERQLLLLYRKPGPNLPSEQPHLKTLDLATIDDPEHWKKLFYREVGDLLQRAVAKINSGSVEPIKGDHCTWCDYGELCRRSALFSEDDSPFGADEVMDVD